MKVVAILALAAFLAGCNEAHFNAYCQLYKPVYWSKADTRKTIRQVAANNAVWISQNCPAVADDLRKRGITK